MNLFSLQMQHDEINIPNTNDILIPAESKHSQTGLPAARGCGVRAGLLSVRATGCHIKQT